MFGARPFARVGQNSSFVKSMMHGHKDINAPASGSLGGQKRQALLKRVVALSAGSVVGKTQFSPGKFDFALFDKPGDVVDVSNGAAISEDGTVLKLVTTRIDEEQRKLYREMELKKRAARLPSGTHDVRLGQVMHAMLASKFRDTPIAFGHVYEVAIGECNINNFADVENVELAIVQDHVKPYGGGKEAPHVFELAPELCGQLVLMMREAVQNIPRVAPIVMAPFNERASKKAADKAIAAAASSSSSSSAAAPMAVDSAIPSTPAATAAAASSLTAAATGTAAGSVSAASDDKKEGSVPVGDLAVSCRHMFTGANWPVLFMPADDFGQERRGARGLPFVFYGDPEIDVASGTPHRTTKNDKPVLVRSVSYNIEFVQFLTSVEGGSKGDLTAEQCRMQWPDTRPGAHTSDDPAYQLGWYDRTIKVNAEVRLWGEHLSAYGVLDQKYYFNGVLASLVCHTPALSMCYVSRKNALTHQPSPEDTVSLSLSATGSSKGGKQDPNIVSYQWEQNQAVLTLLPIGVVNAGYPMTYDGVIAVLKTLAVTFKNRFAVNMNNAQARKQYEANNVGDRIPKNNLDFMLEETPHVFNVWETTKDMGSTEMRDSYSYFAVFNLALKRENPDSPGMAYLRSLAGSSASVSAAAAVIDQIALQIATNPGRVATPPEAVDIFNFAPAEDGQAAPPRPDFIVFGISNAWLAGTGVTPLRTDNHLDMERRAMAKLYPTRPPVDNAYVKAAVEDVTPLMAPPPPPPAKGQNGGTSNKRTADAAAVSDEPNNKAARTGDAAAQNSGGDAVFDFDPVSSAAQLAARTTAVAQ